MVTYRDRQHRLDVIAKISKDKECLDMYEELVKLLTPGTGFIKGDLKICSRIEDPVTLEVI
jgi:hypothetical protein